MKRNLALEVLYHVIDVMLQSHPYLYRPSIMLLPKVLIMMDKYDCCHDFLVRCRLQASFSASSMKAPMSDFGMVDAPIQTIGFDDDPLDCEKQLVLDLIYVKIELKSRIEGMQALAQLCNTNNTPLDTIGEFLGVPKQWRKIRTPVVERQCCDLIKLMFRLNRKYVSGLILQCELTNSNSAANSAAMLPSSSFKALHALLAVRQWCQNKDATRFLKEIAADIPQTLPRRRSTS